MKMLHELFKVANARQCKPIFLVGFFTTEDGEGVHALADEELLREILKESGLGRAWLHKVVDIMCDGLKPPDDRPKDIRTAHFVISPDDSDAL